jgi:hypothetical protein
MERFLKIILWSGFVVLISSFSWAQSSVECPDCGRAALIDLLGSQVASQHAYTNRDGKIDYADHDISKLVTLNAHDLHLQSLTQEEQGLVYFHVLLSTTSFGAAPENASQDAIAQLRALGYNPDQFIRTTTLLQERQEAAAELYAIYKGMDPVSLKAILLYSNSYLTQDEDTNRENANDSEAEYARATTRLLLQTLKSSDEIFTAIANSGSLKNSNDPEVISKILDVFEKADLAKTNICPVLSYLQDLTREDRIQDTQSVLALKVLQIQKILRVPADKRDVRCDRSDPTPISEQFQQVLDSVFSLNRSDQAKLKPKSLAVHSDDDICSEEATQAFIGQTMTQYKSGGFVMVGKMDSYGCTTTIIMKPQDKKKKAEPQVEMTVEQQAKSGARNNRVITMSVRALKNLYNAASRSN